MNLRTYRLATAALLATTLAMALPTEAIATPGALDTSFSETQATAGAILGGRINIPMSLTGSSRLVSVLPSTSQPVNALADIADPALWAVGTAAGDIGIAGLTDTGAMSENLADFTTGHPYTAGRYNLDINGTIDTALKAMVDPSGRLLIVGTSQVRTGFNTPFVARLKDDGSLDTSFNSGISSFDAVKESTLADAFADDSGNTFIAGNKNGSAWIAMVNPVGRLASGFGSAGIQRMQDATIVSIASDGNAGIYALFNALGSYWVLHYDQTSAQVSWSNGSAEIQVPATILPNYIKHDGLGIILAGRTPAGNAAVLAYGTDGNLNPAFADAGLLTLGAARSATVLTKVVKVNDYTATPVSNIYPSNPYLLVAYESANGVTVSQYSRATGLINTGWGTQGTTTIAPQTGLVDTLVSLDTDRNSKTLIGLAARPSTGADALYFGIVRLQTYDLLPSPVVVDDSTTPSPGSITVAFDPGTVTGTLNPAPVLGYEVSCTPISGGASVAAKDTTGNTILNGSPITVQKLKNGTTYTCVVTAVNSAGRSVASAATRSMTPLSTPGAPTGVTVLGAAKSLMVRFSPPEDNGGLPIDYYVTTCTATGTTATTEKSADTYVVVPAPVADGVTSNSCTVKAHNLLGLGNKASEAVSAVTDAKPNAPIISGVTSASRSLAVAFNPNLKQDPGTPAPSSYTATCTSATAPIKTGSSKGSSTDALNASVTVRDLSNNFDYTCTVLATNVYGDSKLSAVSLPAKPLAAPVMPSLSTIAAGADATTIIAKFKPGTATLESSPATKFTVSCLPDTAKPAITADVAYAAATLEYTATLTGVDPTASYSCSVVAKIESGTTLLFSSTASPALTIRTGIVPVGAPSGVTAAAGSSVRQISMAFTPVITVGTTYKATCVTPAGATLTGTTALSPVVVDNVDPTITYSCSIMAVGTGGTGPSSLPVSIRTGTVPATPAITVSAVGRLTLAVDIAAPVADIPATTKVTCINGTVSFPATGTGTRLLVIVKNAGMYTCSAVTTNAIGSSIQSAASLPVTVTGPLEAPTDPIITTAYGKITLTTKAVYGATSYVYTCTGDRIAYGTALTPTITLAAQTGNYTCHVIAKGGTEISGRSGDVMALVPELSPIAVTKPGAVSLSVPAVAKATAYRFVCTGDVTASVTSKSPKVTLTLGAGVFACTAAWKKGTSFSTPTTPTPVSITPFAPKVYASGSSIKVVIPSALPKGLSWTATCVKGTKTTSAKGSGLIAKVKSPGSSALCYVTIADLDSKSVKAVQPAPVVTPPATTTPGTTPTTPGTTPTTPGTTPAPVTPTPTTPGTAPVQGVTAGAFCTTANSIGKTTAGIQYTCKTSSTDAQLRWRL